MLAKDFKAVFSNARFKVACRYFLVLAIPAAAAGPRLGVVVSKKNVPSAVQRNRVKRLIRENFRKRQTGIGGADLVVLARKNAHTLGNSAINGKMDGLWNDLTGKMQSVASVRQENH